MLIYVVPDSVRRMVHESSIKNYWVTLGLVLMTGFVGGHRFYVGKVGTGILFLLTGGLFAIGWIVDIFTVAFGNLTDKGGNFIRPQNGGTHDRELAMTNEDSTAQPEDTAKKKTPVWVWVIAGVVALALLGSLFGGDDSDESASEPAPAVVEEDEAPAPAPEEEPAEEVPAPEEFAWPEMAPLLLEGSGDDVVILEQPIPAVVAMDVVANASSRYFGISPILASGESGSTLVNTTDPFDGTVLLLGTGNDAISGFEVTSNGPWTFTIKSISEVTKLSAGETLEGNGDGLIRLAETQGLTTISVVANSESRYFGVRQQGDRTSSVINTTDAYDGTVKLDPGTILLEVTATGGWQITLD